MDTYVPSFKSLAIAHGIFGYIVFCVFLAEELHNDFFYKYANPLIGDIHKYLTYLTYGSLAACGFFVFYSYKISVISAWTSIAFFILTWLAVPLVQQHWPKFRKSFFINLSIRVFAAAVLTYQYSATLRS